jgi:hypothetical protein
MFYHLVLFFENLKTLLFYLYARYIQFCNEIKKLKNPKAKTKKHLPLSMLSKLNISVENLT